MDLISIPFAILAITSVLIYYLINYKFRVFFLVLISCGFIAGFNFYLLLYVVGFTLINYLIGINIPDSEYKNVLFRIGLIINLLQLVLLKYSSFMVDPVFRLFEIDVNSSRLSEIILPLGISYFTLQGIGYLVNVKMGWEKPERRFSDFLLYIIFFPKFLSGPIERSNHFLPQLKADRLFGEKQINDGLRIALFGFFKKVVIANQLGGLVNSTYTDMDGLGGLNLLIVVLIQPLYLYFDFSGYTDIAIGLTKAYGIDLLPNFNRPFLSENVTTFWKRFHMSLSLWFNDYVFKQVSFRCRKWGKYAAVFAVFVTFTLFGIWHGAGWNFMFLGLIQALAINYEFFSKKTRTRIFSKMPYLIRIWTGRAFTYSFFGLSLIFFFSPDLGSAFKYLSRIFEFESTFNAGNYGSILFLTLFFAMVILFLETLSIDYVKDFDRIEKKWNKQKVLRIGVYFIVIILIVTQIGGNVSFIYQMF